MADKYVPMFELGSGSFGNAWVMTEKSSEEQVVAKVIQIKSLSKLEKDRCITEVAILSACKHANIVRYIEAFTSAGSLHIVMEYARAGDLQQRLKKQEGVLLSREVVLDWFVQIVLALEYIHSRNILHRDLKPQNVFLTDDGTVKLGDFGISKVLCNNDDLASTMIGTPFYISPEICEGKLYNSSSDMWAAGCLLYQMCHLNVPFDAPNLTELTKMIHKCQFTPTLKEYGVTTDYLITKLLVIIPDERLTAKEILSIPELSPFVTIHKLKQTNYKKYLVDSRSQPQVKASKRSVQDGGQMISEKKSSKPIMKACDSEYAAMRIPLIEPRVVCAVRAMDPVADVEVKPSAEVCSEKKDSFTERQKEFDNSHQRQHNVANGSLHKSLQVKNFNISKPDPGCLLDKEADGFVTEKLPNTKDAQTSVCAEGDRRTWSDNSPSQRARLKSRTYTVKASVARRLSEASPKLSDTIAKQRFALSVGDAGSLQSDKTRKIANVGTQDSGSDNEPVDEVFTPPTDVTKSGQRTKHRQKYDEARKSTVDPNNNEGVPFGNVNATIIEALSVQGFNKELSRRIIYNGLVSRVGEDRSKELLSKVRKTIIENGQSYQTLTGMINIEELELIPLIGMLCF